MKTKNWLKEADAIIIECEEDDINPHTLVSVSPFNTKTNEWLKFEKENMTLQEALKINKKQIVHSNKLIEYLKTRMGKKIFD